MRAFFLYLISTVFSVSQAFAGLPPTTAKGQAETGKAVTFNFTAPNNQFTTNGAATRLIETGNDNRLKNPMFHASTVSSGWAVGAGVTANKDDTYYYEKPQSLQLVLPAGSATNLVVISQTYAAEFGDLARQDLEASILITKSGVQAGVSLKWCLDIDSTQVACQDLTGGENVHWVPYKLFYPAKPTSIPTNYRVYIVANYSGIVGVAGYLSLAKAYFGPAKSIAYGTPPTHFTAKISSAGVVSDESPMDWINGNCGSSSPYPCTFVSGIFTQAPNCQVTAQNTGAVFGNIQAAATATGVSFQGVTSNTATATNTALVVSCDKVGADVVQPAVTAQNWNYDWRPLNPSAAQQGLGNITVANPMECKEKRDGGDWLIDCRFTTGTVSAVEGRFALKPGLTIDNTRAPASTLCGKWWRNSATVNTARTGAMLCTPGNAFFQFGFDYYAGSSSPFTPQNGNAAFLSSEIVHFTARVPVKENGVSWTETWNALQLVGSVVADTNVKADKAAGITSIDYGTYSAVVTGGANAVSVTSPTTCNFSRIGTFVSVTCPVSVGCSSVIGVSDTNFTVSLPISTTNSASINGSMGVAVPQEAGRIAGGTSTRASANFRCFTSGAYNRPVVFSYMTK